MLVHPHGNYKRSYIQTMPSTLKELTAIASEKHQSQLYMLFLFSVGVFLESLWQDYCTDMNGKSKILEESIEVQVVV